jgi:hypothetical protein
MLTKREIVLGVTGVIAASAAAELRWGRFFKGMR